MSEILFLAWLWEIQKTMPGSSAKGKLQILEWRKELPKLKRVLDIGPGWGTYAKLIKQKGEIWDAVEIFEPYVEKYKLRKLYDNVFIEDALKFIPQDRYNLIILGDVLEHVAETDGEKLLKTMLVNTDFLLVSLPLDLETKADQENEHEHWHNIHEKHLARWSNLNFLEVVSDAGSEIIGLKKFQELAVYLIAGGKQNYLSEHISSLDFAKHGGMLKEYRLNIRTHVSGLIPKSIRKIIKK